MDNVFDKIRDAAANGQGVKLTVSEVWLLDELAGEEIAKAGNVFEGTQELLEGYDIAKRLDTDD